MNDRDPAALLRFAHELIDQTDTILLRHFTGEIAATEKADASLVTAADTEVESLLRARLSDAFPGHGLVGEEYGTEPGAGDARWIIDPLDATHNFVRGIPVFATLLALERDGELVLGIVSAPAMHQRWSGAAGKGALVRVDGRELAIRVSSVAMLSEAQLCFSSLRLLDEVRLVDGWRAAVRSSWRDRGFGDFWGHMLVAQGSAEAMLEHGVSVWDLAAPAAILRQAGGRMTDLSGRPSWTGPGVLTSNGLLHDALLAVLSGRS
ncbi:MAG: histidinol phosphatase [Chloroflexota bacterium]|nr:histidinol phosphatase [Chloroflexota bacterium]